MLPLLLLLFVYWFWWLPGVRVANDYPLVQTSTLLNYLDLPRLWNELGSVGLGEFGSFVLWSYPISLFSGILAHLHIGFSLQERIVFVIPILFLGILGIKLLLKKYELSKTAVFISTLFYLTTTYLLLLIDGGQLSIALVYSLFPLTVYLVGNSFDGNIKSKLIALLIIVLITALDVRLLFLLIIIFLVKYIFECRKGFISTSKSYIISGIVIGVGWFLINLFWITPILKYPLSSNLYSTLTQNIGIQPTTWKHALLLLQPQWYKNVFGVVPQINYLFVGIPVVVFFAPVLVIIGKLLRILPLLKIRWKKEILFWTTIALTGIFLAKGSNPPFGFIYDLFFKHVPGFSLFRDSTKFFFLIALSYSVLIAFAVDWVLKTLESKFKNKPIYKVIPWIFVVYCLLLISPVFTGKMTGTFSKPIYTMESSVVADIINKDGDYSRILFVPSRAPLGFTSPLHPSVEALRLLSQRPFAIGVVGNYEKFNYLREAPYMGELFSVAGIKYIYYPYPDTRRETLKQDNIDYYFAFADQLANLSWVEGKISDSPVTVLTTKKTKDHIFLSDNSFYVVGSDRIYWDLVDIDDFDLSKNALVFAEESPMVITNIDPKSKVLLYGKNDMDLLMSFVDRDDYYFPATDLEREPSENIGVEMEGLAGRYSGEGWWKRETSDLIWWKDFLQSKYGIDNLDFDFGGGWGVAEGETIYQIPYAGFQKDENLMVRAMKSNHGGKIEFWQGKEKIGEVVTQLRDPQTVEIKLTGYDQNPDQIFEYKKADFNWYKVGKLESLDPITIRTYGDINVVNAMAHVTDREYADVEKNVASLKNEERVIDWSELTDGQKKEIVSSGQTAGDMTFRQIDPTKYEVVIDRLDKPTYLIFSETFDELWQLNGQSSKRIYSLLNGFYVDKPGVYTLYFTPQKYIFSGLLISGISLISVLVTLFVSSRKSNEK
jgi:hypothetical protein